METKEQISELLQESNFSIVEIATKKLARKTKKKRLTSGNMFYSQFCDAVANELIKPTNKEILEEIKNIVTYG